jgi:NMD protein affecting ribosome stability and mRNA decay
MKCPRCGNDVPMLYRSEKTGDRDLCEDCFQEESATADEEYWREHPDFPFE